MEIIFRGRHLTIGDEFRSHATAHLEKLERHLPLVDHAIVHVRREAKGDVRYVVQVTVSANGAFLRAEERNSNLLTAIDAATAALDRQAKRFKERKVLRSERRVAKEHRVPAEATDGESDEPWPPDAGFVDGRVVRVKRFNMKPMTESEAIDQMELLGHVFFLFHDADRDALALLYRRRDGDYGMIVQEPA
jgi:putative sigma-54 modulation protein